MLFRSELLRQVSEMIMKEEQVLFPLCLELFEGADWARLQAGEESGHPGAAYGHGYRTAEDRRREAEAAHLPLPGGPESPSADAAAGEVPLPVGRLTPEQLALLFTNLPVDVTYVDENDEVRFYSEGHRIFPRSPEIIGRKVINCHPPKSVHVVQKIVDEFRAGTRDVAEFWLDFRGRFVHIRYLALRDADGAYRGVLEVAQDVTDIRALEGQRRLLDW